MERGIMDGRREREGKEWRVVGFMCKVSLQSGFGMCVGFCGWGVDRVEMREVDLDSVKSRSDACDGVGLLRWCCLSVWNYQGVKRM